jgi:predicted O-methyltransferase YrrM
MISRDLQVAIRHPKLLFKYLLRERNLVNFFNAERSEVKAYLREADNITHELALKLPKNAKLGTMLSPLRGPIVYVCVRILKPDVMVETGVASGSSSAYILHAMELNRKGFLYSIDLPNVDKGALVPEDKQTGWLVPIELRYRWKLIFGRSQDKLPILLKNLGNIDALLHDSEHTYETMRFEYENAWAHLKNGGLLLSDDVHWNKAFQDFVKNTRPKRWIIFDGLGAIVK